MRNRITEIISNRLFLYTCVAFFVLMVSITGCRKKKHAVALRNRNIPVSTLEIKQHKIRHQVILTGSVLPWRKEELHFEVSGRLTKLHISTPGTEVKGQIKNEKGKVVREGQPIAEVDPVPYELALEDARARLQVAKINVEATAYALAVAEETIKAAQARIDATEMEINDVLPLNLKMAEDQYKYTQLEYKLTKQAYSKEDATHSRIAGAQTQMSIAESEFQKAKLHKGLKEKELLGYKADLAKAMEQKKAQEAQQKVAEAQLKQALATVQRTETELGKCMLRAPFDGVLSRIYVNPGTLIGPSVPIAILVMMDPVRIDIAVSFRKLRDFYFGDEVDVFPFSTYPRFQKGRRMFKEAEKGTVFLVNTTADPATRTFLAAILARNYQHTLDSLWNYGDQDTPRIEKFSRVVYRNADGTGPLCVDVRCIDKDNQGPFVWRARRKSSDRSIPENVLDKVYIEPSDRYANIVTWLFRELKKTQGLKEGDRLVVLGSKKLQANQEILELRRDWIFHPGEVVKVRYYSDLPDGIYLPPDSIIEDISIVNGVTRRKYFVFVVQNIEKKGKFEVGKAVRREVVLKLKTVAQNLNETLKAEDLWKIEGGLTAGERVIVHGYHSVNDRYEAVRTAIPVRITNTVTLNELSKDYEMKIINKSPKKGGK